MPICWIPSKPQRMEHAILFVHGVPLNFDSPIPTPSREHHYLLADLSRQPVFTTMHEQKERERREEPPGFRTHHPSPPRRYNLPIRTAQPNEAGQPVSGYNSGSTRICPDPQSWGIGTGWRMGGFLGPCVVWSRLRCRSSTGS